MKVKDVMARLGVTKAAVYRRLHGIQTGRFGARPGPRVAWTRRGAELRDGQWHIPSRLVREWAREKLALDRRRGRV